MSIDNTKKHERAETALLLLTNISDEWIAEFNARNPVGTFAQLLEHMEKTVFVKSDIAFGSDNQGKTLAKFDPPSPNKAGVPSKDLIISLIHGAGNHLKRVMNEHPYCDHVQVVKHYADIKLREFYPRPPLKDEQ